MKKNRQDYFKKFWKLLNNTCCYILEDGEKIVQAHEKYPAYWFVSNKGRLLSCYNKIHVIKPEFNKCGKERNRQEWFYTWKNHETKKFEHVRMHRFMVEHFYEEEIKKIEGSGQDWDAHHKRPVSLFGEDEPQFANRIDNLQPVVKTLHKESYKFMNGEQKFQKIFDAAEQTPVETSFIINCNLTDLIKKMVEQSPSASAILVVPEEDGNTIDFRTADKLFK